MRMFFCALVALALGALLREEVQAATKPRPLALVRDRVPFSQLGYEADPILEGEDAAFTFEVPITPRLRAVFLRLRFRLAAGLSPNSTVAVRAGGKELARRTIEALRADPTLAVSVPLPRDRRVVAVRLIAHLRSTDNPCADLAAKKLWVALRTTSMVDVTTARALNRPFIGEFLDPYGGKVQVVVPHDLDTRSQEQATALAYELKRINRWRDRNVEIVERASASSYRIVVDTRPVKWATAGREMHLSLASLPALLLQTEQLLAVADRFRAAGAGNERDVVPQTIAGVGPLPVFATIPVDMLDSRPAKASLVLNLSHSKIPARGLAFVDVYVDGIRASRQMLHRTASLETFDIPLDAALLSARTQLAIVPTYYPRSSVKCNGSLAAMTFGIGRGSRLRWSGDSSADPTVYSFLETVSGRLAVLTSEDASPSLAAQILDILGSVNDTVTTVEVRSAQEGARPDDDAFVLLGTSREIAASASAASVPVSAGWYAGKPALFVSSAGTVGVRGIESAASVVARGISEPGDASSLDLSRAALHPALDADETYTEHLRHNAVPSLTAFACALTFMLFMSRRRERT